jgi:hypothetical protein
MRNENSTYIDHKFNNQDLSDQDMTMNPSCFNAYLGRKKGEPSSPLKQIISSSAFDYPT